MKREAGVLTTTGFVLVLVASGLGQDAQMQPSPAVPAGVLGPQLIVWSQVQKPRPVPQPLPPPDQPVQPSPEQPANRQSQQPDPQQPPSARTFTGTIIKDGVKYVLKVSGDTTYQLDDQDEAKQYEGKQVRIVGDLDGKSNVLHIVSIQLIS